MATRALQLDPALAPAAALAGLPTPVRDLVRVVALLYGGLLDDCEADLRRRRAGRAYLFRFDIPGFDPLPWLHRLKTYEAARGTRIAAALDPVEAP